jgi:FKBP-type peptidyl-prolyl cis-trans isomerase
MGEIMKPIWIALLGLGLSAAQLSAQDSTPLKTEKDKVSYAIGAGFAASLKSQMIEVDPDLMAKGFKDGLAGGKMLMTDDELRQVMTTFQEELKLKQAQALNALGEKNKKEADSFFAANAKKEGVMSLPDGLQYKIVKTATGAKPTDADTVVCQYRGTILDGTEFDSSFSTRQPATFQVGGLIPGFREALKMMAVGSKYQFFVPAEMAYGETGVGDVIGPNAALIFEIELISIEPKPAKSQEPGAPSPFPQP